MRRERIDEADPQMQSALKELQGVIQERWPTATFQVARGEDPEGIYLDAIVDVEDTDEVMDVVVERLLELQVDHGLPLYVIPLRPLARVLKELESPRRTVRARLDAEDSPPSVQP